MVISSGNYDIIESGNAITFDKDSDIVIQITASSKFEFKLAFSFEENGGERDVQSDIDAENNIIKYKCINFGNGAGTLEAIEIGHIASKTMYLHFWIEKIAANNYIRSINYTVYKER